jgi:DNA (cytosine-5)-methyltransferase 1
MDVKTVGTLFTGGGLYDIGAEKAGFKPIWGVELNDKIASVARQNGMNVLTGDVRYIGLQCDLPSPNHIHASPPCPNFSLAKTDAKETELDIRLAESVCWFIKHKNPQTFTLENVSAYSYSESFKKIMKCLNENGYMTDIKTLNAADFGVPQTRRRMIVRASRFLLHPYPSPVRWKGWYESIEDIIDELPESKFSPWQIERLPMTYKDFMIGNGTYSNPSKAFIVDGQKSNNGKNVSIRDGNEPVFTQLVSQEKKPLRAFSGGRVVKMTIKALGRFQTVPDSYKGLTVKINGNGFPCDLAEAVMRTFYY